jgi:hypothetical protein
MAKKETVLNRLDRRNYVRYRKFDGKRYEIVWVDKTRQEAELTKEVHQRSGQLVRVVKNKYGYVIYTRSKY